MLSKHLTTLPRLGGPLAALGVWLWASFTFPSDLLQRITNALMLLMIPLLIAAYYWWLPKIGGILLGSAISQLPKVLSEQLAPALEKAFDGLFQRFKMKGLSELGNAAKQNKAAVLEAVGVGDPAARALVKAIREESPDMAEWAELLLLRAKSKGFNLSARVADIAERTVLPKVEAWAEKRFPGATDVMSELKQLFKIQDLLPGAGPTEQ